MGLQLEYINFINETCALAGFQRATGLKMCELGNQQVRKSAARITKAKTGKEYFSSLGYDHTSIDRNGLDGALPLDLCEPIQDPELIDQFDVLTNSGTSEHVEEEYECFKNLHSLVKQNGIFIHLNPKTGSWPRHGLYYYTFDFHHRLASQCDYEILRESDIALKGDQSHLVCVGLRKRASNPFISRAEFEKIALATIFRA
ncbi:MAG: hypothetical protein A2W73_05115 [Deltaproteobacteria bacterium RIFCSPLOWO2_12_55_13]|nr:MAG: hypothetical protein A2W73_05115 [Deltaproteobacteria bacterium RIFCSPLOWO2_12_55_13]